MSPAVRRVRENLAGVVVMLLVSVFAMATGTAEAAAPASPAVNFTNPIAMQRADPHIFKHTDGFYYFTATVPAVRPDRPAPGHHPPGPGERPGDGDLAQAHQRRDGRAHLGAGDPLHQRQVVRLLRRGPQRRHLAHPDVRAGDAPAPTR